jgi:hypothetical protein
MDQFEQLRENIRLLGWQIKEIALYDSHNEIIGWLIDGIRCREGLKCTAGTLLQALQKFLESVGGEK